MAEVMSLEQQVTKEQALDGIMEVLTRFNNLLINVRDKKKLTAGSELYRFADSIVNKDYCSSFRKLNWTLFDNLSADGYKQFLLKCKTLSDKFELMVRIPKDVEVVGEESTPVQNKTTNTTDSWKVYLDKDNQIIKVEYGSDKQKAQIIDSDGKLVSEVEMVGKDYEGKGFAKKLLTVAGQQVTNEADLVLQEKMLDDGLFYINKEEGWIEKKKYFERMTPADFLSIQDYKDVTVKAVYDDNKGELTFTYTVGGKTETLFVINASNNQKNREWPTISGNNITDNPQDIMYTTPPYGEKEVPYIPGKFPKGKNWKITSFEKNGEKEYGPYKIRTDAWRWVEVWELVENKKKGVFEWQKKKDSAGNIVKAKDSGLLIHGGGWSESNLDNKKGTNKYTDTTLGCIRISNLDVELIEKVLHSYLNLKKINLEVK